MALATDTSHRWVAGAVIALLGVLALAQSVGVGGRTYADAPKLYTVHTAAEAYEALRSEGVEGRILVLLDERSRIVPRVWMATFMESLDDSDIDPPVMKHNMTSCLIYAGIAREVYFVPPQGLWETEYARASSRADSLAEGQGVRLRFYGAPVHVRQASDLPPLREKAIVYIAGDAGAGYTSQFIAYVTSEQFADVVIRQVAE